jgi:hypothetical protein
VKTPIQTTSRKCQNSEAHQAALVGGDQAALPTCTISVSQIRPKVTCRPCVPTSVKNEDRKALRCGVAPSWIRCANS